MLYSVIFPVRAKVVKRVRGMVERVWYIVNGMTCVYGEIVNGELFACMPNKLDRIICLLCVYICHYIFPFLLFGRLFFSATLRQKALLYQSSRNHIICMDWKFWDFSRFV